MCSIQKPVKTNRPTAKELGLIMNLHVLDCFTVWDPSLDGEDNDGDGAIDEEDTGRQLGDKGGPEVRVFGKIDLNMMSGPVMSGVWPDGEIDHLVDDYHSRLRVARTVFTQFPRAFPRDGIGSSYLSHIGPFETIGDVLRADSISCYPGTCMGGPPRPDGWNEQAEFWEIGINTKRVGSYDPQGSYRHKEVVEMDDDGDGIDDERDERDMIFTWVANHLTTRANVFNVNVKVDLCDKPGYPGAAEGDPRALPFKAWKSDRVYAHKQLLGILDRSTCLRVNEDNTCDFSGPVDVRLLTTADDMEVY